MRLFEGYRRDEGGVGVRNLVVVLSTVFCGSTVARKIAAATGAVLVAHQGGCVELGPEAEHTDRILRGVVAHPNVGGVLVVGLGCEQVQGLSLGTAANNKPFQYLEIQDVGGPSAAIEAGIGIASELLRQVKKVEREPVPVSELKLATQCGSSDTGSGLASNPAVGVVADKLVERGGTVLLGETGSLYGAAGLMARRAVSREVGARIIEITDVMERYYGCMGESLKEANPTPGNIAGGLTTLVEKSLGGVRKGGTTPIRGVLKPGEQVPKDGKGLWVMDTTLGVDTHATTDMVAGGAQLVVFTTGRGNPVGCPIAPVLKVTATSKTVQGMSETIDFDASTILRGEESIEQCGERMLDELLAVASGKLTQAEKLDHSLFGIGRVVVG